MKKCSVCEVEKDDDEFYYDAATDNLTAKCRPCRSRFVSLSREYKSQGRKLTTKLFKELKLYRRA